MRENLRHNGSASTLCRRSKRPRGRARCRSAETTKRNELTKSFSKNVACAVSLRKDTILFLCYQLFSERFFISRNAKKRRLIATFRCHRKRAQLKLVDTLQKQAHFSQKHNNFSHFLHWFETGNHYAPKQHPTGGKIPRPLTRASRFFDFYLHSFTHPFNTLTHKVLRVKTSPSSAFTFLHPFSPLPHSIGEGFSRVKPSPSSY